MNLLSKIYLVFLILNIDPSFTSNFERFIERWDIASAEKYLEENKNILENFRYRILKAEILFYRGKYSESLQIFKEVEKIYPLTGYYEEIREISENLLEYENSLTSIETENFIIRYKRDKDFPLAFYIGEVLEAQLKGLQKIFSFKIKDRILVEIMPDIQTFALSSPLKEIEIRRTGTVGLCKYGKIMITSPLLYLRGYHWASTAAHELVHFVEKIMYGDFIPLWLNEGIAKYFENEWRKILGLKLEEPDYLIVLKRGWEKGLFVPFEDMHPSIAKLPSGEHAGVAFAEVESFVSYFIEKFGLVKFLDLLQAIDLYGGDFNRSISELVGKDFAQIEKDWKREMEMKISTVGDADIIFYPELKSDSRTSSEEEEIEHSSSFSDFYRLGNLLYKKGYYLAASYEYKKAHKNLNRRSPFILNKLGLSLMKAKRYEEALNYFKESLKIYPQIFTSNYRAGQILAELKKCQDAIPYLREALFMNPYHPRLHELLQKCYENSGDLQKAEGEKEVLNFILKNIIQ